MDMLLMTLNVIQSMGISLGVGASTLAVTLFFLAIRDGQISSDERSYLGVVYFVLRVAMAIILSAAILLAVLGFVAHGESFFTGYTTAQTVLITILFVNAFLMTLHIIPSTLGPAIQAASWYGLGFLASLYAHGIKEVNLFIFFFAYLTLVFFALSFINAMMVYLNEQRKVGGA
jgi:hypothetical protein